MNTDFLSLFFDAEYYFSNLSNTGTLDNTTSYKQLWDHFLSHDQDCDFDKIEECNFPNKFFEKYLHKGVFQEVDGKYVYILNSDDEVSQHELLEKYAKRNLGIIKEQLHRLTDEKKYDFLDNVLSHSRDKKLILTLSYFLDGEDYIPSIDSVRNIEDKLKFTSKIGGINSLLIKNYAINSSYQHAINLVVKYAVENTDNQSEVEYVTNFVSQDTKNILFADSYKAKIYNSFSSGVIEGIAYDAALFDHFKKLLDLKAESLEKQSTLSLLFDHFEKLLDLSAESLEKQSTLSLIKSLLIGAGADLYDPHLDLLPVFVEMLKQGINPISEANTLKVILKGLERELVNSRNLDSVIKMSSELLDMHYEIPNPIAQELSHTISEKLYQDQSQDSKKLLGLFLSFFEKIIGKQRLTLSEDTWKNLYDFVVNITPELNELIHQDSQLTKKALFLNQRLLDKKFELPLELYQNYEIQCEGYSDYHKRILESFFDKGGYRSKCLSEDSSYKTNGIVDSNRFWQDEEEFTPWIKEIPADSERTVWNFYNSNIWSLFQKEQLFTYLNSENSDQFYKVLKRIVNYEISPFAINREGLRVIDVFSSFAPETWDQKIKNISDYNRWSFPRSLDEILEEIQKNNPPEIAEEFITKSRSTINKVHKERKELGEFFEQLAFHAYSPDKTSEEGSIEIKINSQNDSLIFSNIKDGVTERFTVDNPINLISNQLEKRKLVEKGYNFVTTEITDRRTTEANTIYVYPMFDQIYIRYIDKESNRYIQTTLKDRIPNELQGQNFVEMSDLEISIAFSKLFSFLAKGSVDDVSDYKKEIELLYQNAWYKNFKNSVTEINDDNLVKVLTVASEAMHKTFFQGKHHLRDVQLLSVLAFLESDSSRLIQVSTGEGKTAIVAITAAMKAMTGLKGDVVTSSSVLAKEAVKQEPFFNLLGLTVDHAEGHADNNSKSCYKADIVYGSSTSFIGDLLKASTLDNYRYGRTQDFVILDEVDNILIDQIKYIVKISEPIPGFENLEHVLYQHISIVGRIFSDTEIKDDEYYYKQLAPQKEESDATPEVISTRIGNQKEYKQFVKSAALRELEDSVIPETSYTEYREGGLGRDKRLLIPNHLNEFLMSGYADKWVDSFFGSMRSSENKEYIVQTDTYSGLDKIRILDKKSGVVQHFMKWSDGLHQIISIKYGLSAPGESLINVFMSLVNFILGYKGNIYGLTGTLGDKPHLEFYEAIFGADAVNIPTFAPKNLQLYAPILVQEKESFYNELSSSVLHEIGNDRGVLIISETIEEVYKIQSKLKKSLEDSGLADKAKIKLYFDNYNPEHEKAVNEKMSAGTIIIATNLGGRGTDIGLSKEVEENGGMHLIFSYFSHSSRVDWQGFGRPARKGEPGSAQLIAFIEQEEELDIDALNDERYKNEVELMSTAIDEEIPNMLYKDTFHDRRVALSREVSSPLGEYKIIESYHTPEELEEQKIYVFLVDGRIHIQCEEVNEGESFDISDLINDISKDKFKHMSAVLSDKNERLLFEGGEFELIQYLLALEYGFISDQDILVRMEIAYKNSIRQFVGINTDYIEKNDKIIKGIYSSYSQHFYNPQEISYLLHNKGDIDTELDKSSLTSDLLISRHKMLFDFWSEDRKVYTDQHTKREQIDQFALWFKQNLDQRVESDGSIYNPLEHKELVEKSWQEFVSRTKKAIADKDFIRNPAHLVKRAHHNLWNIQIYLDDIGYEPEKEGFELLFGGNEGGITIGEFIFEQEYNDQSGPFSKFYTSSRQLTASVAFDKAAKETVMRDLDKAIELDYKYSVPAHLTRALVPIIENAGLVEYNQENANIAAEVKTKAYADSREAHQVNTNHQARQSGLCIAVLSDMLRDEKLSHQRLDECLFKEIILERTNNSTQTTLELIQEASRNPKIALGVESISSVDEEFEKIPSSMLSQKTILYAKYLTNSTILANSANYTVSNITTMLQNSNSTEDQRIASILKDINPETDKLPASKYSKILDEARSQGLLFYKLKTYELEEEEQDLLEAFAAIAISVGMISFGLAIAGPGAFSTLLGNAIAVSGATSLLSTTYTIANGGIIHLEDYMKGVAINLAVGIISAGISSLVATPAKLTAHTLGKAAMLGAMQFGMQVASQEIAGRYYEKNQAAFEKEAQEVFKNIILAHEEDLKALFLEEDLNNSNKVMEKLRDMAISKLRKFSSKYHSTVATLGKAAAGSALGAAGRAAGVGGGGDFASIAISNLIGSTAVNMVSGYSEAKGALDHIADELNKEIAGLAKKVPTAAKMMEKVLATNLNRNNDLALDVITYAVEHNQGFAQSKKVKDLNCDKVKEESFDIGQYGDYKEKLEKSCKEIKALSECSEKKYSARSEDLKSTVGDAISKYIGGIWKNEVLSTSVNFAMSTGVNYYNENSEKNNVNQQNQGFTEKKAAILKTLRDTQKVIAENRGTKQAEFVLDSGVNQGEIDLAVRNRLQPTIKPSTTLDADEPGVSGPSHYHHSPEHSPSSENSATDSTINQPYVHLDSGMYYGLSSAQRAELEGNSLLFASYNKAYEMLSGQGVDVDNGNLFHHVTNAYQDSQQPGFFEGISNVFESAFGMQDSYADKTELNAESQKLATSISGSVVEKYLSDINMNLAKQPLEFDQQKTTIGQHGHNWYKAIQIKEELGDAYTSLDDANKSYLDGNLLRLESYNQALDQLHDLFPGKEIHYNDLCKDIRKAENNILWDKVESRSGPNAPSIVDVVSDEFLRIEGFDNIAPVGENIGSGDLTAITELTVAKYAVSQKAWYSGAADGQLKKGVILLSKVAKKYSDFAERHPILARYAMDIFLIGAKTIAGAIAGSPGGPAGVAAGAGAGFAAGTAQAVEGELFDQVAGESIRSLVKGGVESAVPALMKADSQLSKEDATLLARFLLLSLSTTKDLSDGLKIIARSTKVGPKMAAAGGADTGNIDTHTLHKDSHHKTGEHGGSASGSKASDDLVKPEVGSATANAKTKLHGEGHKMVDSVGEHFVDDLLDGKSFEDIVKNYDFEKNPRFELGKLEPARKRFVVESLTGSIPEGRIDYGLRFGSDLENYIPGTERLFNGRVEKDLYLINYHDKNKLLGQGEGSRTMQWATHLEVGNRMPTRDDILQHLALVYPDWGNRNAFSIIKIPKGEHVTFVSGKAADQFSRIEKKVFTGGGYQVRFRDFDEKWIIKTEDLKK